MKPFTFKNPNILDGHTWPKSHRKNASGYNQHMYEKHGRYVKTCKICGVRRRKERGWAYLVNGEWTLERPNCLRSVALTCI